LPTLLCAALALAISMGCSRTLAVQPLTELTQYVAEDAPVVVACRKIKDKLYLPVIVNGHPTLLGVDTGADGLTIDAEAVPALGLRYRADRHVEATGAFERVQARCLETFTVEITDIAMLTLTNAVVGCADPQAVGSSGLLGIDVLGPLGAVIDTGKATILFPRASTHANPPEPVR
jgi:predicted aspartyl protease